MRQRSFIWLDKIIILGTRRLTRLSQIESIFLVNRSDLLQTSTIQKCQKKPSYNVLISKKASQMSVGFGPYFFSYSRENKAAVDDFLQKTMPL